MIKKQYTIVETVADLAKLIDHINRYDYFGFDTESTGLNVRKARVIGMSICGKEGESYYLPRLTWCTEKKELIQVWSEEQFMSIIEMLLTKELLMWNGSYDGRLVKNDLGIDLIPNLVADVMLMKHTTFEEGDFTLKGCAIEEQENLGIDAETEANEEQIALKENVLKNGGQWKRAQKDMYMADLEVMGPYACADADLTLRLGHLYGDRLKDQGLEDFFYHEEVMPLYREVTIPMEEHGVKLDLELMRSTRERLIVDIEKYREKVEKALMSTKEAQKWFSDTLNKKIPIIKGGAFGQGVAEYYKLDLPKTKTGKYSLTAKNIGKLEDSIGKMFLLGDCTLPDDVAAEIQSQIYWSKNDNAINISSKPQMGEIVCEYMRIKPLSKTKGGKPQFDDNFIQHLEEMGLEWAKLLGDYNKLVKIKGTYIDRFLDAEEEGFYYFSYKQHGTISGRYGSDAQQMPRPKEEGQLSELVLEYTNLIRKFFIAEEGRIFIDADYESLEPHVFGHVSNEESIRDIFRKGHDFYSTIAIMTEGLDGVSADKKAPNYLGLIDKVRRQNAKAYSLGIPYGMGAYALGKTLDISTEEAQKLIDGYLAGFPELAKWMKDSENFVKEHGYIRTQSGRIRHLPRVKYLYKRHKDKLLDWKYRNKLIKKYTPKYGKEEAEKKVKKAYLDYKNGLNNAKNVQIQGLAGSIVNRAAIAINRRFRECGYNAWVSAQIHDQLIMNIPEECKEFCMKIVKDCMENTTKLSLDLKAPPELAYNWAEGH